MTKMILIPPMCVISSPAACANFRRPNSAYFSQINVDANPFHKLHLEGHKDAIRALAASGRTLVSGSYDTTAKIWSISSGKCLRTLTGHFSQIYAIAFDGKKIATGSLDTSVRIWDPTDG